MIYFRRKYFSSKKKEEKKSNGNFRAGIEGFIPAAGVLGSLGAGIAVGNSAYQKHAKGILDKSSEYQGAHKNWKAAGEAEGRLQEELSKASDSKAKEALRRQIEAAEAHTEKMRSAMEHSKGKALDAGRQFEKGVGKSLLKGGAVAGLGIAASLGAKKLYDNWRNK